MDPLQETNGGTNGAGGEPAPEKKKRGKPKDPLAPKKPLNAYQKITGKRRQEMKEAEDPRCKDLAALGGILKQAWDETPEADKEAMQKVYEEEMEIWRPKWAAYKQTDGYKDFFEERQDWQDARNTKKQRKKLNKDAPKRPKSGYMIYAGEVREAVQKEVFAAGGGMGDIGKKISEMWQAVPEFKKAEYGEQSAKLKEIFDVEFAAYKKTDTWKHFLTEKAKLEGSQSLKKIQRTKFRDAPKRPASAYALYRSEVMPKITEECKGLSMGEMGKKVAGMWAEVPEEQKKGYQETAAGLKDEYDKKLLEFKRQQDYTKFLEERFKTKARENKMVSLVDQPKRPKSVFAMFRDEHKTEVTPGKGEGKGTHALKQKFAEASQEEKAALEAKEKEMKEQWMREMAEWKESDKYKGFVKTNEKIKMEFMNDAMKVMTIKFLNRAPPQPPRSAFSLFLHEKRAMPGEASGQPSSKKIKKDEVVKYKEEWVKLDKLARNEYESQMKDKFKQWTEQAKEYMGMEEWKEYVTEAKRLKIPVKSLLRDQKKVIKVLKNGMRVVPLPDKPFDFPSKPADAWRCFTREKKGEVPVSEMADIWSKMDPEEKKKYTDEADELQKKYVEEMKAFKASEEGSTYLRKLRTAQRTKRVTEAKFKYLKGQPKKPASALKKFMLSNLAAVKKEQPMLKGFEIRQVLENKWKALEDSEREAFQAQAAAASQAYDEAVAAFKAGEEWKLYVKATAVRKVNAKTGKAVLQAPQKPANFPVKPPNAMKQFIKDNAGTGKNLGEMGKMFKELGEEEKGTRQREAQERIAQYNEAMEEWRNSEEGRKYLKAVNIFSKRKRLAEAKNKFGKGEPKKPQTAYFIFTAAKRAEVMKEFPELKGLGPVQQKLKELWEALGEEEKQEWTKREEEAKEAYSQALQEFHSTPDYKKYQAIVRSINGAGRMKGKGKGASKKVVIPMPPVPDNMPKKPATSLLIYAQEVGKPLVEASKAWVELGAEGQKQYQDKNRELTAEYESEMKAFMKTADAKKYFRLKHHAEKRVKMQKAKERFLGSAEAPKEPKRPQSAYFFFAAEKRSTLSGKTFAESAKEINNMWSALSPEEKKVYEDRYEDAKAKYDEEMKEYQSSSGFKAYEKAVRSITAQKRPAPKPKVKAGRGRGKGAGRGAKAAKTDAADSDSDSDVMGSDSSGSSSSSGSDSD